MGLSHGVSHSLEWSKVLAPGELSRTEECTVLNDGFRGMELGCKRSSKGGRRGGLRERETEGKAGETYCQICSYPAGKTCRWSFRIICLLLGFRSYHWVQMAGQYYLIGDGLIVLGELG